MKPDLLHHVLLPGHMSVMTMFVCLGQVTVVGTHICDSERFTYALYRHTVVPLCIFNLLVFSVGCSNVALVGTRFTL